MESRGHDLVAGRVRQEVAGQLFDREGIESLVVVEGLDHPVAVGPHRALRVALEAVRVGVTGEVEPLHRHVLAVVGGGEETVERLGPSVGGGVVQEGLQVGIRGWQAGQVERRAAQQGGFRGFAIRLESLGGEALGEEGVDRVTAGRDGRDGRLDRRLEGPVSLVFGALLDPTFDERDLILREHLVELGGRHVIVGVFREESLHHFALFRMSGQDGRLAGFAAFAGGVQGVQAQLALHLVLVRPVAGVAGVGEDRPDVAVELDAFGRSNRGDEQEAGNGEKGAGKTHGDLR